MTFNFMKRSCVSIDLEIEKLGIDYRKLRIEVGREFPWHEVMAVRISGKVNDEQRKSEMLPHFEKKKTATIVRAIKRKLTRAPL